MKKVKRSSIQRQFERKSKIYLFRMEVHLTLTLTQLPSSQLEATTPVDSPCLHQPTQATLDMQASSQQSPKKSTTNPTSG